MTLSAYPKTINQFSDKISIIITTYNDGNNLKEAILSVLKSTYPLFEIIVIDDGSKTDEAKKIVESLISELDLTIVYKKKDNGGPSSARNAGLYIAKGEWIVFLDSDDTMLPNSIKSKFDFFNSCNDKKNIAGIYGSFIWSNSNLTQSFKKSCGPVSRNDIGIMGKVPGGAPAYIFKKKSLISINGFDESLTYNEDFDLLLRLIKSGFQLLGTNIPGFIRNVRNTSLTRSNPIKVQKGGRRFLKKAYRLGLMGNHELIKRLIQNYLKTLLIFFFIKNIFK